MERLVIEVPEALKIAIHEIAKLQNKKIKYMLTEWLQRRVEGLKKKEKISLDKQTNV